MCVRGGTTGMNIFRNLYWNIFNLFLIVLAMITSYYLQSLIRLYANLGIINMFWICVRGGQLDLISSETYIKIYLTCVLIVLAMITSH